MLNCCIEHKRHRDKIIVSGPILRTQSCDNSSDSSNNDVMPSDEEFFECADVEQSATERGINIGGDATGIIVIFPSVIRN